MEESTSFFSELQDSAAKKTEWLNTVQLPKLLDNYRNLQGCINNIFDVLVKKSLIIIDQNQLDRKVKDINSPETSAFTDKEASSVLGYRFTDFKMMIDYLCTSFRFTVENMPMSTVKILLDINNAFDWKKMETSNVQSNTHALAQALLLAENNTPDVIISLIKDSKEKSAEEIDTINQILNDVGRVQKEMYKINMRSLLQDSSDFNKDTAFTSEEAEMKEIKRIYVKSPSTVPFYPELVREIILEDISPRKKEFQTHALKALEIDNSLNSRTKRSTTFIPKDVLLDAILGLSAMSSTLSQLKLKINSNSELLIDNSSGFFGRIKSFFRKLLHLKKGEQIVDVEFKDSRTGSLRLEKININKLVDEIAKKEKSYESISVKGPEYEKLAGSSDDEILKYIKKQTSEIQTLFIKVSGLDGYFKSTIEISILSLVKGLQIEASALKNSISNTNRKLEEYEEAVAEAAQKKVQ